MISSSNSYLIYFYLLQFDPASKSAFKLEALNAPEIVDSVSDIVQRMLIKKDCGFISYLRNNYTCIFCTYNCFFRSPNPKCRVYVRSKKHVGTL